MPAETENGVDSHMSFGRILIAIDESAIAAHAADVGVDLARSLRAHVAFVSCVDPAGLATGDSGYSAERVLAEAERDATTLLATMRDRAALQPTALVFMRVGAPGHEVVKVAREWPADLIVMGSHGRGFVPRVLLGSVAEAVLRHAPCALLIVRAPE